MNKQSSKRLEIFLTGHKGFVGSHLLPRLRKVGYIVETDFRYLHTKRYDYIIHLAAVTHTNPEFDPNLIESNFILTKEIFKIPTRIFYASSCSAYFDTNPYAQSKLYAEYLGMQHGNALGLRFFNIYGPNNNKGIVKYLLSLNDNDQMMLRGPDLIRDYIFIDDIVEWISGQLFMENTIEAFHFTGVSELGTGIGTSTSSLVDLFMHLSGKRISTFPVTPRNHEPKCLVANHGLVNFITLEDGLRKLIG